MKKTHLSDYINQLQAKGYAHFTSIQAEKTLGISRVALRAAIRRMQAKGELAEPIRDFHLIIPPQYRSLRCLPAIQFIHELMQFLNLPYYICLLSAGEFYNAAHQKPQMLQVMIPQKRPPLQCGNVTIQWVMKNDLSSTPVRQFKTPYGYVRVSTPEATAKDLVTYPHRSAGMNNVLTVLSELAESIKIKPLVQLIKESRDSISWIQRLGYCFEFLGQEQLSEVLAQQLEKLHPRRILLCTKGSISKPAYNKKWWLLINENLEAD